MMKKSSEQTGLKIYLSQPWNLIKSIFLVFTWIILAFQLELVGPTMPILANNVHVDYTGVSSALAARGAGYLVINIFGAILQNIVTNHSEGLLVCAFILPAIAVFATPFVTSLALMCVLFFIQGVAQGLTDLGGTNILLTMWGQHAAAPLNTAHLGYGIGAVFVNLLVRPFLSQEILSNDVNNNETVNSTLSSIKTPNIVIPYSITAFLCLLIAAGHVFFYVSAIKTRRQKLPVQQVDYTAVSTSPENVNRPVVEGNSSPYSPRTCGRGYFQYGLILSIIYICYTFFLGANDQTFSKFFFSYLKSGKFNISTQAASWGIILYWLSYSMGRLICAIVSVYVSVTMCLNIVWIGGLCLAIAWFIFVWVIGLTTTGLFILGSITGLVFAPLFPLSFGLFNQKLNVIPMLIALLLCGTAIGAITFQKIAGSILDENPNHFPTILIVCIVMSIIFYVISHIICFLHQRKTSSNVQQPITYNVVLASERLSEEEHQMANYLRDQEDK